MRPSPSWLLITFCIFAFGCSREPERQPQAREIFPPPSQLKHLISTTQDSMLSTYREPGFVFKYGVDAQNVLNTFAGTYTLIADTGKSPSIRISLTADEIDSVFRMIKRIGFYEFPDTFRYVSRSGKVSYLAGSGTAVYFGIRYFDGNVLRKKELWWIDHFYSEDDPDERAVRLRDLILRTRMMIEDKPAVKAMKRPFRFQRYD